MNSPAERGIKIEPGAVPPGWPGPELRDGTFTGLGLGSYDPHAVEPSMDCDPAVCPPSGAVDARSDSVVARPVR